MGSKKGENGVVSAEVVAKLVYKVYVLLVCKAILWFKLLKNTFVRRTVISLASNVILLLVLLVRMVSLATGPIAYLIMILPAFRSAVIAQQAVSLTIVQIGVEDVHLVVVPDVLRITVKHVLMDFIIFSSVVCLALLIVEHA